MNEQGQIKQFESEEKAIEEGYTHQLDGIRAKALEALPEDQRVAALEALKKADTKALGEAEKQEARSAEARAEIKALASKMSASMPRIINSHVSGNNGGSDPKHTKKYTKRPTGNRKKMIAKSKKNNRKK